MNVEITISLEKLMHFFLHTQKCENLEQGFLKGYLMAMGGEIRLLDSLKGINWDLMLKNPKIFVKIYKDMVRINIEVAEEHHEAARALATKFGVK